MGLIPEMIIAHHMGVQVLLLGMVTHYTFAQTPTPDSSARVPETSQAHVQRLRVVLVRLCKVLHRLAMKKDEKDDVGSQ